MKFGNMRSILAFILIFLARTVLAETSVRIGQNFTGAVFGTDSQATPADGNGAVGPNHFVQFLNGNFTVFDKRTGSSVIKITDETFWANAGVTLTASLSISDPRLIFDVYSQRWFAAMIDLRVSSRSPQTNRFLIAVSENSDPSKAWNGAAVRADSVHGYFADFPTMGIDENGVYLSGDLFDRFGNSVGPLVMAFSKPGLLAIPIDVANRISSGQLAYSARGQILQPTVTTGSPSTPELLLSVGDIGVDFASHDTLILSSLRNGTNGTLLDNPLTIIVPTYQVPINPVQPGGSDNLDDGDARIGAAVRRVDDLVYAVHAIQTNNHAAIRWYKLDAVTRSLLQAGTITETNLDLFYPSIAANEKGNVVIGCNGTSPDVFVSSFAIVGETVNGQLTFGPLRLLKSGIASYDLHDSSGTSRWGDYSATSLDPSDPGRFWTIQMYPVNATTWATQITELIVGGPTLNVVDNGSSIEISWPDQTGSVLQYNTDLSQPLAWLPVTELPVVLNGQAVVSLPLTNSAAFFRLLQ
ncbi:MAG: hypothetical protein JWM99_2914 [Verrucomicrobiales bacterium]|nr:hypothetical protein [Verrucomicrobiales bacterium]